MFLLGHILLSIFRNRRLPPLLLGLLLYIFFSQEIVKPINRYPEPNTAGTERQWPEPTMMPFFSTGVDNQRHCTLPRHNARAVAASPPSVNSNGLHQRVRRVAVTILHSSRQVGRQPCPGGVGKHQVWPLTPPKADHRAVSEADVGGVRSAGVGPADPVLREGVPTRPRPRLSGGGLGVEQCVPVPVGVNPGLRGVLNPPAIRRVVRCREQVSVFAVWALPVAVRVGPVQRPGMVMVSAGRR